jgi:hypothetical protein
MYTERTQCHVFFTAVTKNQRFLGDYWAFKNSVVIVGGFGAAAKVTGKRYHSLFKGLPPPPPMLFGPKHRWGGCTGVGVKGGCTGL